MSRSVRRFVCCAVAFLAATALFLFASKGSAYQGETKAASGGYDPLAILNHPDLPKALPESIQKRMEFLKESLLTNLDKLDQPLELPLSEVIGIVEDLASLPEAKQNSGKRVKILVDEISISKVKGEAFDAGRVNIKLPRLMGAPLFVVLDHMCRQIDCEFRVGPYGIVIFSSKAPVKIVPLG